MIFVSCVPPMNACRDPKTLHCTHLVLSELKLTLSVSHGVVIGGGGRGVTRSVVDEAFWHHQALVRGGGRG